MAGYRPVTEITEHTCFTYLVLGTARMALQSFFLFPFVLHVCMNSVATYKQKDNFLYVYFLFGRLTTT